MCVSSKFIKSPHNIEGKQGFAPLIVYLMPFPKDFIYCIINMCTEITRSNVIMTISHHIHILYILNEASLSCIKILSKDTVFHLEVHISQILQITKDFYCESDKQLLHYKL